jgi:hypothetical protein
MFIAAIIVICSSEKNCYKAKYTPILTNLTNKKTQFKVALRTNLITYSSHCVFVFLIVTDNSIFIKFFLSL